ncbi:MAG: hypothetical protein A2252_01120 [Elusimicrobia bacterium RIFOXYA2_FULL_39_19]|nr:MAG: hypothetical protein A2252_01120 [Elusimicrobia bacterium RIFOXYA2_FULL_39_19]
MSNNQAGQSRISTGQSVGVAKEKWLEVMFYLSLFFGVLHFFAILGQVVFMAAHTVFAKEFTFGLRSSMLMGHLYLTFLAAYVGPKEFVRWLKRTDDEVMTLSENKKITRGMYIVIGWAVFTGVVVFLWQLSIVNEVPETLLYTLGEVVALLCGTEASKYLRNRSATQGKQDTAISINYADKVLDYCKTNNSIDRIACQKEFGLSEDQAYRLLKKLVSQKKLVEFGENKGRRYKLA